MQEYKTSTYRNIQGMKKYENSYRSISQRNFSANIVPDRKKTPMSNISRKTHMAEIKEEAANQDKLNNLQKFFIINEQFKKRDNARKAFKIRPIVSAEPSCFKVKANRLENIQVKDNKITQQREMIIPYNDYNQSKKTFKKPFSDYSFKLVQNGRDSMEDFHLAIDRFKNKSNQSLFGIFDGHGGTEAARMAKEILPLIFSKIINYSNIEDSLKLLFSTLDEEILSKFETLVQESSYNPKSLGSTCTVCYLTYVHTISGTESNHQTIKDIISDERVLYTANVGDSRALLIGKTKFKRLTYDHKASDEQESNRIKNQGGILFRGRIFGQFGLSRALGNSSLKKYVTSNPYISKTILDQKDRFLVIASDGIWDVISDQECFNLSIGIINSKDLCDLLVDTAIKKWSKDNISCIVIKV